MVIHIDTEPVWRWCVCNEVENKVSEILRKTKKRSTKSIFIKCEMNDLHQLK